MSERNMEIGREILRQLGGSGRLKAMIGVKDMFAIDNGLQFSFRAKAKNKANMVQIVLAGNDSYTVAFYRLRGITLVKCGQFKSGVYCDVLKPVIENELGLRLSF